VNGTGIGLYMAKWTMDTHKGEVQYKTQKDKGTTFTLIGSPTVTALSSSSTNLTINFNKLTQGYATANISNGASTTTTLNSFTFSNPIAGGQYTIMISLTGTGGFTPTLTITPPTVASSTIRFNFASISVTTSSTTAPVQTNPKYIVLTIAYDGINYYISGSAFNN
jgi:hypothetical protein